MLIEKQNTCVLNQSHSFCSDCCLDCLESEHRERVGCSPGLMTRANCCFLFIPSNLYCTSTPIVTWGRSETAPLSGDRGIKSTPKRLRSWDISSHFISSKSLIRSHLLSLYQTYINIAVSLVFTYLWCSTFYTFRPHFCEWISSTISWKEHNRSHGVYCNRSSRDSTSRSLQYWYIMGYNDVPMEYMKIELSPLANQSMP